MAENSKIEWTDHTFNPWHGCVKVSQGCKHCYADAQDRRFGPSHWGSTAERRLLSEAHWQEPLRWNADAEVAGIRRKVFCASMADVFEQLPDAHPSAVAVTTARLGLWKLIEATPWLDWLLLTKRPENVPEMVPACWLSTNKECWPHAGWPANVWLGTSVEDQAAADTRIPLLLKIPATIRFLSCEPLLGSVDLTQWLKREGDGVAQSHGRERRVPRSDSWGADDRRIGASLATGESALESLVETVGVSSIPSAESRTCHGELSSGPRDAERETASRLSASPSLATSAWPNSAGIDDQPQERSQDGQSSLQFGACDLLPAATSRNSHSEDLPSSKSMGRNQPHGEADHGTSVGDQDTANGRREAEVAGFGLRRIPTSDFQDSPWRPKISWLIAGGESGREARPMHPDWARTLRDHCRSAGVPFFFKQHGEWVEIAEAGARPGDQYLLIRDGAPWGWPYAWCSETPPMHGAEAGRYSPWRDVLLRRVGKKNAGRLLDGREWSEFPESAISQAARIAVGSEAANA